MNDHGVRCAVVEDNRLRTTLVWQCNGWTRYVWKLLSWKQESIEFQQPEVLFEFQEGNDETRRQKGHYLVQFTIPNFKSCLEL